MASSLARLHAPLPTSEEAMTVEAARDGSCEARGEKLHEIVASSLENTPRSDPLFV